MLPDRSEPPEVSSTRGQPFGIDVARIAPSLAEAVVNRLEEVLPGGWSAEAAEGDVVLKLDGVPVTEDGFGPGFPLETSYRAILSAVQDEISEHTTDPWPHDPSRTMHLYHPEVDTDEDLCLHAWFGPRDHPVLRLRPISLVELAS